MPSGWGLQRLPRGDFREPFIILRASCSFSWSSLSASVNSPSQSFEKNPADYFFLLLTPTTPTASPHTHTHPAWNRVQPSTLARPERTGSHDCVSDLILADTDLMAPLATIPFSLSRTVLMGLCSAHRCRAGPPPPKQGPSIHPDQLLFPFVISKVWVGRGTVNWLWTLA